MWLLKSKETRFLEKTATRIRDFIVSQIPQGQLISLYLAGRILTKDRSPKSDFDFFGIVSDEFNLAAEDAINNYFKKHPEFTSGRECRFRAIYISDFEGKTKGKSNMVKDEKNIRLYLKLFRHSNYRLMYGKRIDFSRFSIENITDEEEIRHAIQLIEGNIKYLKSHHYRENEPYHTIPNTAKWILRIAMLESVMTGKCKYEPNFYKVEKVLRKDRGHIFHTAIRIRREHRLFSLPEKKKFISEVEDYVKSVKESLLISS